MLKIMDSLTSSQLSQYLHRIGLSEPPDVDLSGLRILQTAQFFSIPFENFDIRLGLPIDVSNEAIFEKLVRQRRGGYCFELNGLMLQVLKKLGFSARPLLARVHMTDPPSARTHQLTLVEFGTDAWLVDVGFGAGGPRTIIELKDAETQLSDEWAYRLSVLEPWGWMLQTRESGGWKNSYSFDLGHVIFSDIELGNHFTSTSENTHFTQVSVASLPTPEGRISIRDLIFTEVDATGTQSYPISREWYLEKVESAFGIELPAIPPMSC